MKSLKEAFVNYQHARTTLRGLKRRKKELLEGSTDYAGLTEEITGLREKRKNVELSIMHGHAKLEDEILTAQTDMKSAKELCTDLTINLIAKGQPISVKLPEAEFIPEFSMKYRQLKFNI